MKIVEYGHIFLLACRQLRKEDQHNFIGQLKDVLNVPIISKPTLATATPLLLVQFAPVLYLSSSRHNVVTEVN